MADGPHGPGCMCAWPDEQSHGFECKCKACEIATALNKIISTWTTGKPTPDEARRLTLMHLDMAATAYEVGMMDMSELIAMAQHVFSRSANARHAKLSARDVALMNAEPAGNA